MRLGDVVDADHLAAGKPLDGVRVLAVEQMQALAELRAMRDNAAVSAILARIEAAARTSDAPLMPLFVEAVEAYATRGEICDAMRRGFGEYAPDSWV